MKKNGFTLIELLAVIIILAIVALISTPIILNVVDEARESANKSSVAMYADAVKLAVIDDYFENQSYPTIDETWVANNVEYGGERVTCGAVYYTENEGVTLYECTLGGQAFNYVDDMEVSAENIVYCYTKGKVYTDCTDPEYMAYYTEAQKGASSTPTQIGYVDESNANQPKLFDNMVAVKYDYDNSEWKVADTNEKWYDYDAKEWANAVVLKDSITKNVGDTVNVVSDVAQMYVWIPRYKYTIFNDHSDTQGVAAQSIDIEFINGTGSDDTVDCTPNTDGTETCTDTTNGSITAGLSTYTHPAFILGTKELTGIWVGKFETSQGSTKLEIKPNVASWRDVNVSTFYTEMKDVSTDYALNADSHMMKNMEWGAVAYLSHSIYGMNDEVWINNSDTYTTGCSGSSVSASSYSGCQNAYDTVTGQNASTTGNIYGVYDMSGGAYEYVMGNMKNSSGGFYSSQSGFTINLERQYYDEYKYDTTNITHNRGKLGDATKETLITSGNAGGGWYSDLSSFPKSSSSWFIRGGYWGNTFYSGMFYFSHYYGGAYSNYAARLVVS